MSRAALLHSDFRVMKTTHGETQTIPGGINAHKIGQTLLVIISTFTGTREIAILLIFLKSYLTNIHSKDIMTLRRYSHNGIKWTEFPHDTLDAKSGVSILSMGRPRTSTAGSAGVRAAPRACSVSASGGSSLRPPRSRCLTVVHSLAAVLNSHVASVLSSMRNIFWTPASRSQLSLIPLFQASFSESFVSTHMSGPTSLPPR